MTDLSASRSPSAALTDQQEYRLLFASTFAVFLAAALVLRLLRVLGVASSAANPRSLIAEARATGHSALAFAFQG